MFRKLSEYTEDTVCRNGREFGTAKESVCFPEGSSKIEHQYYAVHMGREMCLLRSVVLTGLITTYCPWEGRVGGIVRMGLWIGSTGQVRKKLVHQADLSLHS